MNMPSLPDWVKGSRYTGMRLQWVRLDNTSPDLTSATIAGRMRAVGSASAVALSGTLAPDTSHPELGYFTYTPSADDVDTAGVYEVQFTATFGTTPDLTFVSSWTIRDAI